MTDDSGETKNSTTGYINNAGMFSYLVEQSFRRSLKPCSASSYETVCCWNALILFGKDPIRFSSSSLLCGSVARRFPI